MLRLALLSLLLPAAAGAQSVDSLRAGAVHAGPARPVAVGAAVLVVDPPASVWSATKRGMGIGLVAGAAIGGVAGFASWDARDAQGCVLFCFSRGGLTAIGAVSGGAMGLVLGGITGAIVGVARRPDERVALVASPTRAGVRVAFR